ncbi:DUF4145 domain-containing protein [Streptomyces sp. NPDC101455]|uniref:DUF4145 domain-containing protein n=1 Tax=Streptomyces sp. NPDC101455 TaxID=3366142 RepID=UPI0037F9AC16
MQQVHEVTISSDVWGESKSVVDAVFQCDGCNHLTLAPGRRERDGFSSTTHLVVDPFDWIPLQVGKRTFDDVPDAIASLATESHQCLAIKASRAAVALARAVVEATAKERGIQTGSLAKKIDKLFEERFIREHVRDAAHEVRFGGNEVAHGDLVSEPVDFATATEILGLMDEILEEVFQSPARVARLKQQRLAREQRSKNDTNTVAVGEEPETVPVSDAEILDADIPPL